MTRTPLGFGRGLALLLVGGAALAAAAAASQEAAPVGIREYRIGPQDLLEIKVQEVAELQNFQVRVSQDGTVTLPLLGTVKLEGLTKDDVERRLAQLLKEKYVNNPQVSVFIREYMSQRVSVIGAVVNPGMHQLVGRVSLLQMISQAGGLTDKAAREAVILREGANGDGASISIDLDELMINGNASLNVPLQANDVINIPVDRTILVYVFGEVRNPGALEVKLSKKITLLQAIAQAGGLTENGSKSGVTIKRLDKGGREQNIKVSLRDLIKGRKPDVPLKEGDVVYVKEAIF